MDPSFIKSHFCVVTQRSSPLRSEYAWRRKELLEGKRVEIACVQLPPPLRKKRASEHPEPITTKGHVMCTIIYLFICLFILESKSTNISFLPRPPLHVGPGDSSHQRGKGYPSGSYVHCRCNLSTTYRPSFPYKKNSIKEKNVSRQLKIERPFTE